MAEVAVVGAGVGGMAAALRLRAAGHDVVVLERNAVVGGKLAAFRRDGFSFDTGPSLLTLPAVFDDLLGVAGRSLAELGPVRLDPTFRYRFADGSGFDTRAALSDSAAEAERLSAGSGAAYRRFHEHGRRIWEVSERTFFAGPLDSPVDLARRLRSPSDLVAIDPLPTLAARARRAFADARLRQWAGRYATYAGSSPYRAPATLACIPFLEQEHGAWYLRGGLAGLADALREALAATGVEVRTGADVEAVVADPGVGGRVRGVRLAGGEALAADVVVANVDAAHLYRDLLPDPAALRRVRRAGRSGSGFVLLLGVAGRTPGLAHHNVAFSADYAREFADLFDRGVPPADPTVYVCCSAVTDPARAPAGDENWFVLVNVPAGSAPDDAYADHVLGVMAARGFDLAGRVRFRELVTPADLEARYRSLDGAIYGTSSNGRRAAFCRPANRGPRRGLYLVGGSSHPGGGLPLVATSGAIVAAMVAADLGGSPRRLPALRR